MTQKGKLYLIPAPLGEGGTPVIPAYVIQVLHQLDYFIAERAKTARAFIKTTDPVKPFDALHFSELNKHTNPADIAAMLNPTDEGHDIGLLSEAGCPGIADPGAAVVQIAHERKLTVVPLVGPSSILLALMASGLNGQQFCFHGYLPPQKNELSRALRQLEQESARTNRTQLFIETPYRNNSLVEQALQTLQPTTSFCLAVDLTLPTEYVRTLTIADWQRTKVPDLHKRPAIFLLQAK
ncbi:MAG: SAM-dependent methyltransferase [Lewinellaceae bacterium]|nr:SAM-dependent methyltransferase [Lewinellaceae bacterium]